MDQRKARVIAFYLPQFHPIPENDAWWGKGFTEWTNVAKAKPLFRGHHQPNLPADLGYYDLRVPEVREAQAELAREAGIEGFCYWHYWFGNGRELLERPFKEVLKSGKPDFPFCLGWANHSWSNNSWCNTSKFVKNTILMEQTYPGEEEHTVHFYAILDAFKDKRYITVDGKPLFLIYSPATIPNVSKFLNLWRKLAIENGLNGIHFVGVATNASNQKLEGNKKSFQFARINEGGAIYKKVLNEGFDAISSRGFWRAELIVNGRFIKTLHAAFQRLMGGVFIEKYEYEEIIKHFYIEEDAWENVYPTIFNKWDRSARQGKDAQIYAGSSPVLFRKQVQMALDLIKNKEDEHKIIFLMSWNEWAEGNYIEPDQENGKGYLDALAMEIKK